jgi:hypothetical protein
LLPVSVAGSVFGEEDSGARPDEGNVGSQSSVARQAADEPPAAARQEQGQEKKQQATGPAPRAVTSSSYLRSLMPRRKKAPVGDAAESKTRGFQQGAENVDANVGAGPGAAGVRALAQQYPELAAVLQDPRLREIASDVFEDPANAQQHIAKYRGDPEVTAMLKKMNNAILRIADETQTPCHPAAQHAPFWWGPAYYAAPPPAVALLVEWYIERGIAALCDRVWGLGIGRF